MNAIVTVFVCVIVLALLVIAWIAYCMFFKERHKNQVHYDISDLRSKNYEIAQEGAAKKSENKSSVLAAGIFMLPPRHKQKDDYEKRPDYPESPMRNSQPSPEKLIDVFNDAMNNETQKETGNISPTNACAAYHSDV